MGCKTAALAAARRRWPSFPTRDLESAWGAWEDLRHPSGPSIIDCERFGVSEDDVQAPATGPFWAFIPEWCAGMMLGHLEITVVKRGVRVVAVSPAGRRCLEAVVGGSVRDMAVRLWSAFDGPTPDELREMDPEEV